MDTQRLIANRYSLAEPILGSTTGLSWRAMDQWTGQPVVITRVPVSGLGDAELVRARQEIAREVQTLGGLRHQRLAPPVGMVFDEGDLWVASEPLPGATMAAELDRRGPLEPAELARWGADVVDGLAAAHEAGVVHRNLHAGVIGIAPEGRAVVGGFATTVLTREGLRNGVLVHAAPELIQGAQASPASDVFALGAMLSSAVEGHGPTASAQLGDLLARMLHPDPAQRPAAITVTAALRQLGAAVPAAPQPAISASAPNPIGSVAPQLAPGPPASAPPWRPAVPPSYGPPPWDAPPPQHDPIVPEQRGPGSSQAVTDPAAPPRNRAPIRWMIVAAVVAVLALAGGLLIAFRPSLTAGLPGLPAPPPSPIGDPRTADPCGLLSVASVQRFGSATMYRDFGPLQQCVIDIAGGGTDEMNLFATFATASDRAPLGIREPAGELTIFRAAASGGVCRRTVVLGDRSRVYVEALAVNGPTTELCSLADAGTQTAIVVLSSGNIPRRDIDAPPGALTGLDTCALLDQAALRQVPGLDASRRQPGIAGWTCLWGDNPAFEFTPVARVAVARRAPLIGQPVQIGGRSAQILPGGSDDPGSCRVRLVQRSYLGSSGESRVEVLEIDVSLDAQQPTDVACRAATALAEAAAPKLPAVA